MSYKNNLIGIAKTISCYLSRTVNTLKTKLKTPELRFFCVILLSRTNGIKLMKKLHVPPMGRVQFCVIHSMSYSLEWEICGVVHMMNYSMDFFYCRFHIQCWTAEVRIRPNKFSASKNGRLNIPYRSVIRKLLVFMLYIFKEFFYPYH